jgi:tRNA N6-adenosine threonylcarbamoyltransferase
MRVLGIETSCDETAAAIVGRDDSGRAKIHSNVVLSQIADHAGYGGVVPEIAARAHLSALDSIVREAVRRAGQELGEIDAIAATAGPGLVGGLLVGLTTAKAIAAGLGKPFLAINHLEGHALTARLTDGIGFPYLILLVSGGHSQILEVKGLGEYRRLATTIDDAIGEAFDKTAKLVGLPFPGGPSVERAALTGNDGRWHFPRPLKGQDRLDFSLSGLKTAVRIEAEKLAPLSDQDIADLCASFQEAVCDMIADRAGRAIAMHERITGNTGRVFVAAGGVAANVAIRERLEAVCQERDYRFLAPPLDLCGDNAAVIAWAGLERLEAGERSAMDVPVRPRWPLDESAPAIVGHGKRGVKV